MPALWSPEDLATRFATYIEELHDLFAMHGLHYGSPEDIRHLAARLETNDLLKEELGALVRSMVLREGGSLPRTDLLEIVAIAVAGPRMDAAGEDLQQAVRQLLTFLHNALRRPWNEPHGEERLHPAEDPRAEAARELREAAARIEAEAQNSPQQVEIPASVESIGQDHAQRGNVIPFGRARAVFSRLARIDGTEFDGPLEQNETLPLPAEVAQVADSQPEALAADAAPVRSDPPALPEATESAQPGMPIAAACEPASVRPEVSESGVRHKAPWLEAISPPPAAAVIEAKTVITESVIDAQEVRETPELVAVEAQEHTPEPFFAGIPIPDSVVGGTAIISEFDEEPPLPATPRIPRINRAALLSGIAATVLIAAGLGFAIKARSGTTEAVAQPQQRSSDASHAAKPFATLAASTMPQIPAPATEAIRPKAHISDEGDDDSASAGDDGYVAPPYSNLPPSVAPVTTAVAEPSVTHQAPAEAPASIPPVMEHRDASLQQVSEVRTVPVRPREPDASIVGDPVPEIPLHPSIAPTVMAENIVSAPLPDYPMLARIAHADGAVVLHAEITPRGTVSDTHVISGHYLLRRAAEAAVRHWKYRPYQVNGKPVPVSTTITVHFKDEH